MYKNIDEPSCYDNDLEVRKELDSVCDSEEELGTQQEEEDFCTPVSTCAGLFIYFVLILYKILIIVII